MAVVHFYLKGALKEDSLKVLGESDIDIYNNRKLQIFCKVSTLLSYNRVYGLKILGNYSVTY